MKYFKPKLPVYMTSGIAEGVDRLHLLKCMGLIEEMISSGTNPDYLQVFNISYDMNLNQQKIVHSQEKKRYQKESVYKLPDDVYPFSGKIFIMDELTHIIILLAEDY